MDAVLTPHRSLSELGFQRFIWVFAAMNLAVATYFWVQGAWPVMGFLGLDVFAVWLAFRLNFRAARVEECVKVSGEHLHVARRSARGASHWAVSPLWAKVTAEGIGVRISAGGASMNVGAFLSPDERADFARALNDALSRARRGS